MRDVRLVSVWVWAWVWVSQARVFETSALFHKLLVKGVGL